MQEQVEQREKKQSVHRDKADNREEIDRKLRTKTKPIYERDFTTAEVATMLTFGLGSFIGISTAASYGMLELIDYLFIQLGAQNETLWVMILFALNAIMITLMSKVLLPRLVRLTYAGHQRLKRVFKKN